MTDNYKILGQTTAASIEPTSGLNQATTVYTVPVSTQASISSISVLNSSSTSQTYSLGVVRSSDVDSSVLNRSLVFVSVCGGQTAYYSTNGISWTPTSMPYNDYWISVVHGNDRFFSTSISYPGLGAYSTNGITWTQVALPGSTTFRALAYGNGKFIAIGSSNSNFVAYSTDAINWGSVVTLTEDIQSAAYGNGFFIALPQGGFSSGMRSTDGITWTYFGLPTTTGWWRSLAFGNGLFVAASAILPQVVSSTDGFNWQLSTIPVSVPEGATDIAYGDGKFVVLFSGESNNIAAYSTNGTDWISTTMPSAAPWDSITHSNGLFVAAATAYDTTGAYSTDGITWTQTTNPAGPMWLDLASRYIPGTDAILSYQVMVPTRSIASNAVDEIVGGITLSPGDQIRIYSESEDLVVHVYGVEIV